MEAPSEVSGRVSHDPDAPGPGVAPKATMPAADADGAAARRLAAENAQLRQSLAAAEGDRQRDAGSGLPNAAAFSARLDDLVRDSLASGVPVAILVIGVERLLDLRQLLGFAATEEVVARLADRLRDAIAGSALLARVGDQQFGVAFAARRAPAEAGAIAHRLIAAIDGPLRVGPHDLRLLACAGIACLPDDGVRAESLLAHAHAAQRFACENGARPYEFFTPLIGERSLRRLRLEAELRRALDRGEFCVHYQPRRVLPSGRIVGFEALLRWDHPERGCLVAGEFIDVAIDTGLITPIGETVVRRACRDAVEWPDAVALSVNLSTREFRGARLESIIDEALGFSGLAPARFQLELTAASLQGRPEDTDVPLVRLTALRERGVQLVLDNFGAASGGPELLRRCRPRFVKIDAALVRALPADADVLAVVRSVVTLAEHFGATVIAEGIEDGLQAAAAQRAGCAQGQGYFLGRPATATELRSLL